MTGIAAPIGICASKGLYNKNKHRYTSSLSLFVSVLDLGALVQFRISDGSSPLSNKVEFRDFFSPGLFLVYNIGSCPFSIYLGGNYSPILNRVTIDDQIREASHFRISAGLVVDIPIANIFTNYENHKH